MKDSWKPNPELITWLEEAVRKSDMPDKPVVGTGKQSYSIRQILEEVKSGKPFGRKYQKSWEKLEKEGQNEAD